MADTARTVLVTGGTGGLGAAVTAALLADGWRAVVPWIREAELERVQEHERLELVRADLFDPDDVARAVRAAASMDGAPLKAVANLVGGYEGPGKVADVPFERFERMFELNLKPTYLVTQRALPRLVAGGGGAIVCVSSRAGVLPFGGAAGYCASKAAVLAFAKAVAKEYGQDGVRCNAILPSAIATPAMLAETPPDRHHTLVAPEEIARVVRFLCSEESAATTGTGVPVYGRG